MNIRKLSVALERVSESLNLQWYFINKEGNLGKFLDKLKYLSLNTNVTEPLQAVQYLQDLKQLIIELNIILVPKKHDPRGLDKEGDLINQLLNAISKNILLYFERPKEDIIKLIVNEQNKYKQQNPDLYNNPLNNNSKKRNNFDPGTHLQKNLGSGAFTHDTKITNKLVQPGRSADEEKYKKHWFEKLCDDKTVANHEVITQEFFRLLMPYYPKTRLVTCYNKRNIDSIKLMVISQGIPNSDSLENFIGDERKNVTLVRNKITIGEYKGIGRALVGCLFIDDKDPKLGNLLVNSHNEVIKIDGDKGLASLRKSDHQLDSKITAFDINALPFVRDFEAINWLDIQHDGDPTPIYYTLSYNFKENESGFTFSKNLGKQPHFRLEINETLLQIMVMPDKLLRTFIESYISDHIEIQIIYEELINRKIQLIKAALQNNSFLNYLHSEAAVEHFEKSLNVICEFNINTKNNKLIKPEFIELFKNDSRTEFKNLRELAPLPVDEENPEEKGRVATSSNDNLYHIPTSTYLPKPYPYEPLHKKEPIHQTNEEEKQHSDEPIRTYVMTHNSDVSSSTYRAHSSNDRSISSIHGPDLHFFNNKNNEQKSATDSAEPINTQQSSIYRRSSS